MLNILVLTDAETTRAQWADVRRMLDDGQRGEVALAVAGWGDPEEDAPSADMARKLAAADLVLLDAHGAPPPAVGRVVRLLRAGSAQIVPVGSDAADIRSLLRLGRLTAADLPERPDRAAEGQAAVASELAADYARYVRIAEYWRGGGAANLFGLLCLAGRAYGGCRTLPEPADPALVRELCLCDPADRAVYPSRAAYRASRGYAGTRPVVALFWLGNGNPADAADVVGRIARRIEAFADVLPIAFPSVAGFSPERLRALLLGEDEGGEGGNVDLIVSFLPFRLGIGPAGTASGRTAALLEEAGAPLLHPFFLSGATEAEWRESARGLTSSQLLVQVALPELDGAVETYPVAALRREDADVGDDVGIGRLAPIPERTERLVRRVRRWLALRRKPNRDKKLAVVCYNYPPGEANVFGGAFLDTFASVSRLLTWLKRRGYDVEELSAEELRSRFADGGLVNSGKWTGERAPAGMIRYADPDFADRLKGKRRGAEALARWGEPPGGVMTEDGAFLVPGLLNGNVFIGLQPSRGVHEQPEQALHDRSLPPTHQYEAFYRWIREELRADAVLHVGTHGTLEFLPGKEAGLSGDCAADDLLGDLPHLYYYYVGNPSEAMIAKRRSHAVLIGYQAPPFAEAELYGDWLALEALLHEYREAELLDPDRCADVLRKLRERAAQLHVAGTTPDEMEEELYRMKRSLIPSGLHVLGDAYAPEAAAAHMRFVLRHERGEARSLRGLLAERGGRDAAAPDAAGRAAQLRELDREAAALADAYIAARTLPAPYASDPPERREELLRTLAFGYRAYLASLANEEAENLLRALEGRHVPAKLAGDALRSPEVLPSGRNLYQFDPRAVPSRTAAARGAAAAENSLRQYVAAHGEYPRTTAVVLWGLETSRTQGETIGQILHYIGVRVGGGSGTFRTEYEIVPLAELGRPRLNVVVHMTGIFRDMFPNLLDDLNRVFRRVSELEEPEEVNFFRAHTRRTEAELLAAGSDSRRARDLANARIFGPAEGEYGTAVGRLVETKRWQDEAELGDAYAAGQQHVYSLQVRGQAEPELFRAHLRAVDIVSQIRSDHEREVTDSDHYYEYFGGLSKAVERERGSRPAIHITDTTGEQVLTETADRAIVRGVRTRLTNPKWIDGLLAHPYHGAQQIARRCEYVLGLAATTGQVEPWVFDSLHETYIRDEARSRQMAENNRWAYHAMIETLLESHQRGYWQPDADELERLRRKYVELEGDLEAGT